MKKALLMILDGWGLGNHSKADAIFSTPTPHWDALLAKYPHSQLQASGENVGLPDGQMGNSEVGHLNIGAGRVVYQDLVKINRACKDGSIKQNPEIVSAFTTAKETGKKLHTKRSAEVKQIILDKSKDFNGVMNDVELIAYIKGITATGKFSRNSFYKYKAELKEEHNNK